MLARSHALTLRQPSTVHSPLLSEIRATVRPGTAPTQPSDRQQTLGTRKHSGALLTSSSPNHLPSLRDAQMTLCCGKLKGRLRIVKMAPLYTGNDLHLDSLLRCETALFWDHSCADVKVL